MLSPSLSCESARHRRRSVRLRGYDYRQPGAYFVTVCTQGRLCLFGHVVGEEVRLSPIGAVVRQCWVEIPLHFPHVGLDAYVVMPNHIHGILVITGGTAAAAGPSDGLRAGRAGLPADADLRGWPVGTERFGKPVPGSIPTVVRSFKAAAARLIDRQCGTPADAVWQRGYYEHVIRSERALARIRRYIVENPLRWTLDRDNPDRAVRG